METPLSPLEFLRRARRLYPDREAVVDEGLGFSKDDRVAYIAPSTHALLESFYAIPQIGAVLVPINYRLIADDFAYIIGHSGAKVICAHSDYLEVVERIRHELPEVKHVVALEGLTEPLREAGWLDYETVLANAPETFTRPPIAEDDLLTINYPSGTTSRPKGVMITHRNAYINVVGTLIHISMSPADRYLWTLPMFHANGWTFVWVVTAVGARHICLRRVEPKRVFELIRDEHVTVLCAAPTGLIGLAGAAPADRGGDVPKGIQVFTAGAPPAAATIGRVEGEFGWDIIHVYGLTETAPFITICEPRPEHASLSPEDRAMLKSRQGVELITSGELLVVDDNGREVPWDGETLGEIVVRGNVVMKGYYNDPEATAQALRGGWFHTGDAAVVHPDGYVDIRDRLKDVIISGGENISSVEVEGVLLRHAAVQEAAVVGLPDEKWGEAPHAFVVLKAGGSTSPEELRVHTRAQ